MGKNDIEKVGDSTLNVVQGALKAKNNGFKKEGRGGYFLNLLRHMWEHIHVLILKLIAQRFDSVLNMFKALYQRQRRLQLQRRNILNLCPSTMLLI
jgi:hypothetical protein